MPKPKPMLTWEIVKTVAELNGVSYTITQESDDQWGVAITDPDGVVFEVSDSIEEAKQFCENTAAELQAEEE